MWNKKLQTKCSLSSLGNYVPPKRAVLIAFFCYDTRIKRFNCFREVLSGQTILPVPQRYLRRQSGLLKGE